MDRIAASRNIVAATFSTFRITQLLFYGSKKPGTVERSLILDTIMGTSVPDFCRSKPAAQRDPRGRSEDSSYEKN